MQNLTVLQDFHISLSISMEKQILYLYGCVCYCSVCCRCMRCYSGSCWLRVLQMDEVLQRQMLVADEKKREEKKKWMEEGQERFRTLGRGSCKPKKNTVRK